MIKGMVDGIAAAGANVLFVQKGIDDLAQHFLAEVRVESSIPRPGLCGGWERRRRREDFNL